MVLPPSEPRITIAGSNRLVRPASDLRGPLGVAPFKELHITSTVMKGDGFGGREWAVIDALSLYVHLNDALVNLQSSFAFLSVEVFYIRPYMCWIFDILSFQTLSHLCDFVCVHAARRPGVMEVMHNLDYCDVLVIGEELNPDRESLEIQHSALLGKHLDATNSTSGISIYGRLCDLLQSHLREKSGKWRAL